MRNAASFFGFIVFTVILCENNSYGSENSCVLSSGKIGLWKEGYFGPVLNGKVKLRNNKLLFEGNDSTKLKLKLNYTFQTINQTNILKELYFL